MKKFKLVLFLFIGLKLITLGQAIEDKNALHSISNFLSNEDWKSIHAYLEPDFSNDTLICSADPVKRFIFGHSCVALKQWNSAMNCFYCSNDTTNSETLVRYYEFAKSIFMTSENSATSFLLGDAYARIGIFDSANFFFDQSLALNNQNVMALNARATINWIKSVEEKQTSCRSCTDDWNNAIAFDPMFADAIVSKGVSRILAGQHLGNAEIILKQATDIDPDFALANNGLKVIYHKTNPEKYYEYANKSKECPFSKVDEFFLIYDSLMDIPAYNEELTHIIDSLQIARGATALSNTPLKLHANAIKGAFDFATATGDFVNKTIQTWSLPSSSYSWEAKLSYSYGDLKTFVDRGGVYSYQIEGQNKKTSIAGIPSITGTWFLLNYPNEVLFINN
jgi:tetratricopeptide (TPR) repeat protein